MAQQLVRDMSFLYIYIRTISNGGGNSVHLTRFITDICKKLSIVILVFCCMCVFVGESLAVHGNGDNGCSQVPVPGGACLCAALTASSAGMGTGACLGIGCQVLTGCCSAGFIGFGPCSMGMCLMGTGAALGVSCGKLVIDNEEGQQTQQQPVIIQQPQRTQHSTQSSSHSSTTTTTNTTNSFISDAIVGGQTGSLQRMQNALLPLSENVVTALRLLPLKAYGSVSQVKDTVGSMGGLVTQAYSHKQPLSVTDSVRKGNPLACSYPYRVGSYTNIYTTSVADQTIRSGKFGIIFPTASKWTMGLGYEYSKHEPQKQYGMFFGTTSPSVTTTTEMNIISTMIAWNTTTTGFTGHLTSCCGWGTIQNTRSFTYAGSDRVTKGKPDIHIRGAALHVGYILPLVSSVLVVPYIEYVASQVSWSPYKETTGVSPCAMSGYKERLLERSVGLRNQWNITQTSQLQAWIARVFGDRKGTSVTSRSFFVSDRRYEVSVPGYKKSYLRSECGIAYSAACSEGCEVGLDGTYQLTKRHAGKRHYVGGYLQYMY